MNKQIEEPAQGPTVVWQLPRGGGARGNTGERPTNRSVQPATTPGSTWIGQELQSYCTILLRVGSTCLSWPNSTSADSESNITQHPRKPTSSYCWAICYGKYVSWVLHARYSQVLYVFIIFPGPQHTTMMASLFHSTTEETEAQTG